MTMAYRIKRKESVRKAVRRLGCERIRHAIDGLRGNDLPEAIHGARKDIKKIRAVLRLVRAQIPKSEFRQHIRILRKAAARLSAPRDADVKAEALRKLAWHFKRELAPRTLRLFQPQLRARSEATLKEFRRRQGVAAVVKLLDRDYRLLRRLEVKGSGWNSLAPGVKDCHREGRRAYLLARAEPSPEKFHDWRKCAKDLWYYMRLLRRAAPEEMEAITTELETLGQHLGDDHDLAVLAAELEELCPGHKWHREFEALNRVIKIRQGELRAAALSLGARFYSEKPSAFCARIAGYWKIWRKSKNPAVREGKAA